MSIEEQNNHPLYKDAHERFLRAEEQQNIKAAAKYPEPLNPASWTAEELADHAAQEVVDMLRYIEALKAKCEGMERENRKLRFGLSLARSSFITIKSMNTTMFRSSAEKAAKRITELLDDEQELKERAERFWEKFNEKMEQYAAQQRKEFEKGEQP